MLPNRPPRSGLETNNPSLHQSQGGSEGWVTVSPFVVDLVETHLGVGFVDRRVDRPQIFGHGVPVACRLARRKVLRMRCSTQVWITASGQVASIDSGKPFKPSHTTMQASSTPRFLISVSTCNQYLAPSPPVPTQNPRMSRLPSTVTPIAV